MPRAKAAPSYAEGFHSDTEDDTVLPDALPTPESNQENAAPKVKGRGRGKAAISTMAKAKPVSRRTSGGRVVAKKKAAPKKPTTKRGPLKEKANNRNPEDTEEVNDFEENGQENGHHDHSAVSADELVAVKQPVKKTLAGAKRKTQAKKKQTDSETLQQIKGTANDGEFEYTPVKARQTKPPKGRPGRPPARQHVLAEVPVPEKVIPDTQDVVMEVVPQDQPLQSEEDEEVPQSVFRRTDNAQSRIQPPPAVRKRAGSASDTERGVGDPALRRKLGEMTKKFESLDMKYKTLRDVGIKEADANFEQLKKSSEAKSKGNVPFARLLHRQDTNSTNSGERANSQPQEGTSHPESTSTGITDPTKAAPGQRCRRFESTSPRHRAIQQPVRSPKREQSLASQSSQCSLRISNDRKRKFEDTRQRYQRQGPGTHHHGR